MDPGLADPVWRRILELCPLDWGWRTARLYLHIAEIQHDRNRNAAAVIRAMPAGKTRSWLERRFGLARNGHPPASPHAFGAAKMG